MTRWMRRAMCARMASFAWLVALLVLVIMAATPAVAQTLQLTRDADVVDAWPAVTTMADPANALDAPAALAAGARFARPATADASLGMQPGTTWVRIPIAVARDATNGWVMQIDFALLDEVDVWVRFPEGLRKIAGVGRMQQQSGDALKGRVPGAVLRLTPGTAYTVLLRVKTVGPKILPISFRQPDAVLSAELG